MKGKKAISEYISSVCHSFAYIFWGDGRKTIVRLPYWDSDLIAKHSQITICLRFGRSGIGWLVGWLFTSFVYYVNLLCSTLVLFVLIFYSLLSFCVCVYFPDAVDLINSRQQLSVSFFLNFFVSVGKISSDFS